MGIGPNQEWELDPTKKMVTSYIAVCAFIQDAYLHRHWQLLYKVSSPSVAMEEGQITASIFLMSLTQSTVLL